MSGFRIAVTGTPGVGKTTFCASSDFHVLTVEGIAAKHDCIDAVEAVSYTHLTLPTIYSV